MYGGLPSGELVCASKYGNAADCTCATLAGNALTFVVGVFCSKAHKKTQKEKANHGN